MKANKQSLAVDLGMEIVLGCARFDRNDFREIVRENGINAQTLMEQTRKYIKNTFATDDNGNNPAPDDFVEEQLKFWFEGLL